MWHRDQRHAETEQCSATRRLRIVENDRLLNPIILRASSTERLRITESGNVGIGTSSPPAYSLTVDAPNGQALYLGRPGLANALNVQLSGNTSFVVAQTHFNLQTNNGTDALLLDSAQRATFGSGTSGGSKLNVNGGAGIGSTFFAATAPTNGLIVEGNTGIGTVTPVGSGTTLLTVSGSGASAAGNYGSIALRNAREIARLNDLQRFTSLMRTYELVPPVGLEPTLP